MKALFTLLISLFVLDSVAQEPTLLWLKGYGGSSSEEVGNYIAKMQDGGFIIAIGTNSISGSGNIDSFCTLSGYRDVYLKYNSDATALEWYKCFTTGGFIFPRNNGDFIYGTNTTLSSDLAFVIGRENAAGTVIWLKTYGDSADAFLKSMIATDDGGYILAGETNYTNTAFPIHYGSWMDADIAVIKVDTNGNKIWSEVIGGTYGESVGAVVAGPNGGCYIVGGTYSNDHDCTGLHGTPDSMDDVYVVRLDSNGNILWHRDLGGGGGDACLYGVSDNKGGVILASRSSSVDGDVHHHIGNAGNSDYWVVEIDSSNNIQWDNCYGSKYGDDIPIAICKATDGSIWINGYTDGSGNEIDTNYGGEDAWIAHADGSGNFLNGKTLGSNQQDWGQMIYPLSDGNVIAGGYYSNNTGSFASLPFYGESDAFLTVLDPMNQTIVKHIPTTYENVKIYPNPTNSLVNIIQANNGNYSIVINDLLGRQVFNKHYASKEVVIDVSGWIGGIYFVQMTREDGYKSVSKLIVQ